MSLLEVFCFNHRFHLLHNLVACLNVFHLLQQRLFVKCFKMFMTVIVK